jgi:hypothetical protein
MTLAKSGIGLCQGVIRVDHYHARASMVRHPTTEMKEKAKMVHSSKGPWLL